MSLRPAPWPLFGGASGRRPQPDVDVREERPDLKLVEGGRPARLSHLNPRRRALVWIATVGAAFFAVVAFHVTLSQGQFKLEAMKVKAEAEQDQYARLRLRVADLESPARITNEARSRLGMVNPPETTALVAKEADLPLAPIAGSDRQTGFSLLSPGMQSPSGEAGSVAGDLDNWVNLKPHLSSVGK